MKPDPLEGIRRLGLEPARLCALAAAAGLASGVAVGEVSAQVLNGGAVELALVVWCLVFYIVVTAPKRAFRLAAVAQSREAPSMAVSASAALEATMSRPKALLLVRSGEPALDSALTRIKRSLLLGHSAATSLEAEASSLASYSAAEVLRSLGTLSPGSLVDRGEESGGLEQSGELSSESKMPVFITVCFFLPILFVLLVAFSGLHAPLEQVEVLGLDIVFLDIAFYLCSSERASAP